MYRINRVDQRRLIAAELTDLGVSVTPREGKYIKDEDGRVTVLPDHICDWPEEGGLKIRGLQAAANVHMKKRVEHLGKCYC